MTGVEPALVLYHATFEAYLADILRWGLGGHPAGIAPNYPGSQAGWVYLARCPEVARSYAESCDSVPEAWLEHIVVLEVSVPAQEAQALIPDPNVRLEPDELAQTLAYPGVLPALFLRKLPDDE